MTSAEIKPFEDQLLAQRAALLAQIADQRGGVMGRAEVANDHFGKSASYQRQTPQWVCKICAEMRPVCLMSCFVLLPQLFQE